MILVLAALALAVLIAYLGHRAPLKRPEYRPYRWQVPEPPSNVVLPWEKQRPFRPCLTSAPGAPR